MTLTIVVRAPSILLKFAGNGCQFRVSDDHSGSTDTSLRRWSTSNSTSYEPSARDRNCKGAERSGTVGSRRRAYSAITGQPSLSSSSKIPPTDPAGNEATHSSYHHTLTPEISHPILAIVTHPGEVVRNRGQEDIYAGITGFAKISSCPLFRVKVSQSNNPIVKLCANQLRRSSMKAPSSARWKSRSRRFSVILSLAWAFHDRVRIESGVVFLRLTT